MTPEIAALKARIGVRIRENRNTAGMSQESLADAAEVAPSYLSQIENGKRNPSIVTLFRIATALSIDLIELIRA